MYNELLWQWKMKVFHECSAVVLRKQQHCWRTMQLQCNRLLLLRAMLELYSLSEQHANLIIKCQLRVLFVARAGSYLKEKYK